MMIQRLRQDKDFCRGFRRGVGLLLASWVVVQILICVFYPLLIARGQEPTPIEGAYYTLYLPLKMKD